MEPLKGIRIIEATANAAGPFATGMLADQGADVIRLEPIGAGDPARHVGGSRGGVSSYFAHMNRNKRSMAVDLKNPALREPLMKLIKTADVFIQNSRPGALDRCGYGFEDLHAISSNLIYVSISGFGATGPASHQRVYDPVIQAVSGMATAQGSNGKPELVKTIISDKVAAMTAAQAVCSALFARERGHIGGHHVEISMLDASLAFLWPDVFWNHGFVGGGVETKPLIADFYRLVKTKDGYATLIVVGDEEFAGACRGLEIDAPLNDPRFRTLSDRFMHYDELMGEFEKAALKFETADLVQRMDEAGVPFAKVNDFDEVLDDPRVTNLDTLIQYEHPDAGTMRQPRSPAIFAGEPTEVRFAPPNLGQHTEELLGSVGCTGAELAALREAGAIG